MTWWSSRSASRALGPRSRGEQGHEADAPWYSRGFPMYLLSEPIHSPAAVTRKSLPPNWAGLFGFQLSAFPLTGPMAPTPRRAAHTSDAGQLLLEPLGLSSHWKWPWTYTADPVAAAAQTLSPPV